MAFGKGKNQWGKVRSIISKSDHRFCLQSYPSCWSPKKRSPGLSANRSNEKDWKFFRWMRRKYLWNNQLPPLGRRAAWWTSCVTPRENTFVEKVTTFKYFRLRIKTLVMFFNWFSSSFMLYGIALNWQGLTGTEITDIACILILFSTGTLFISFLIAAILDVPGKLLALVACVSLTSEQKYFLPSISKTWMGRRFPYIGLNCFAGLFFLINCFLPRWFFPHYD